MQPAWVGVPRDPVYPEIHVFHHQESKNDLLLILDQLFLWEFQCLDPKDKKMVDLSGFLVLLKHLINRSIISKTPAVLSSYLVFLLINILQNMKLSIFLSHLLTMIQSGFSGYRTFQKNLQITFSHFLLQQLKGTFCR
ncbi:hypothetical protein GOODEAATRI_030920 [Goodea atripinnis]|uniref:Uncharacterized protein n=1 Tax=Goodea atripinnis TaxID=208336 RepID=A0ABV0PIL6_9TELE